MSEWGKNILSHRWVDIEGMKVKIEVFFLEKRFLNLRFFTRINYRIIEQQEKFSGFSFV